ncbi:MAG: sigma-70 family RNA polymerase sigma factor [Bacteroidales bacterium]|jgi:RNA polymerase sigma-70 factor (ECF subfamily)|nr:sigma-70 family RNA polymerase sigma factor [Bacteroidales bacterium]
MKKDEKELLDIINLCRRNDSRAQKELFNSYKNQMFALCLRYSKSSSEAEDMLMQGWLRVFSKIDYFEITDEFKVPHFESWLQRVIVNNAINTYRINKKYNSLNDFEQVVENKDFNLYESDYVFSEEELISCVQTLPKSLRVIFNLCAIDQYSNKDISEILNMSQNSVKSNLYKARQLLKEKLEKIEKKKNE